MNEQWAVEFAGFTKSYTSAMTGRRIEAISALSLKLATGQVLGLLGPNGSGKSTLLKALAGLIRPSAGSCMIMGQAAGSESARALIGYLPESIGVPAHHTGRDFLRYCAGLSSMLPAQCGPRVTEVLHWAGIDPVADRNVTTYSKGMRQRLGLAQAVLHGPRVILLDEPASGLDPEGRLALVTLIRDLAGQGRTVVLSSHLMEQIEVVCDRIAILGRGQLLATGTPNELLGPCERLSGPSALEKVYLEKIHALG